MAKGHKIGSRSLSRIGAAVRQVENTPPGSPPNSAGLREGPLRWFPVKNDTGEDIPPRSIVALAEGALANNEHYIPKVTKQGTTLKTLYVVVEYGGIKAGEIGFATIDSPVEINYDSSGWTPAGGDFGGPKNSSFKLTKGYPTIAEVIGTVSASRNIVLCKFFPELRSVLGKASSDIAAASGTSTVTPGSGSVTVWVDTGSGYVASSLTFTGYNTTGSALTGGVLSAFILDQGRFIVAGGIGDSQKLVKTTSTVASGTSGTVNIWNNGSGGSETVSTGPITATAWNRTSVSIASGKFCLMTPLTIGGATVLYLQPWEC